jgi:DNA-binding transcriptional MocR family regulator
MPLTSIESSRLYRQIAEQLRSAILDGEYPPGVRLPPERDLAQRLGVSRPSVREALIALEVEGGRDGAWRFLDALQVIEIPPDQKCLADNILVRHKTPVTRIL